MDCFVSSYTEATLMEFGVLTYHGEEEGEQSWPDVCHDDGCALRVAICERMANSDLKLRLYGIWPFGNQMRVTSKGLNSNSTP